MGIQVAYLVKSEELSISDIFSIIESITIFLTLVSSVIIFLITINDTNKERKRILFKESLNACLSKIDDFLKLIDPQNLYDYCAVVYNKETTSLVEVYAKLRRMQSQVEYVSQHIHLYIPHIECISEIITNVVKSLEMRLNQIIDVICSDVQKKENKKNAEIDYEFITNLLNTYNTYYMGAVKFIIKGFHIVQKVNYNKKFLKSEIIDYQKQFEEDYKNEV